MSVAQQIVWHHENQDHGTRGNCGRRAGRRYADSRIAFDYNTDYDVPFVLPTFKVGPRPVVSAQVEMRLADQDNVEFSDLPGIHQFAGLAQEARWAARQPRMGSTAGPDVESLVDPEDTDAAEMATWEIELLGIQFTEKERIVDNVIQITRSRVPRNAKTIKRRRKQAARKTRKEDRQPRKDAAARLAAEAEAQAQRIAAYQAELRRIIAEEVEHWGKHLDDYLFDGGNDYTNSLAVDSEQELYLERGIAGFDPETHILGFHVCSVEAATGCLI